MLPRFGSNNQPVFTPNNLPAFRSCDTGCEDPCNPGQGMPTQLLVRFGTLSAAGAVTSTLLHQYTGTVDSGVPATIPFANPLATGTTVVLNHVAPPYYDIAPTNNNFFFIDNSYDSEDRVEAAPAASGTQITDPMWQGSFQVAVSPFGIGYSLTTNPSGLSGPAACRTHTVLMPQFTMTVFVRFWPCGRLFTGPPAFKRYMQIFGMIHDANQIENYQGGVANCRADPQGQRHRAYVRYAATHDSSSTSISGNILRFRASCGAGAGSHSADSPSNPIGISGQLGGMECFTVANPGPLWSVGGQSCSSNSQAAGVALAQQLGTFDKYTIEW